jgi:phage/plasmid-like protein (TIGR03299 family)
MTALIDRVAFVGDNPWWLSSSPERGRNLGGKEVLSAEMLAGAGLDWQVVPQPIFAENPTHLTNSLDFIPGYKALVRQDTGKVLGIKTNRFEPVQNTDAFTFFDTVVGEGQAVYHTAGSLGDGEKVWILAKLPESFKVNGVDEVENYLLLANAHDGNFAFRLFFTPIRVVCQNTLNLALGGKSGRGGYRQTHLSGINNRLNADDARKAIGLASDFLQAFGEEANKLAQTPISADEITALLQRLFPIPTNLLLSAPKKTTLLLPEPKRELLAEDFGIIFKKRDAVEELIRFGKGNNTSAVAGTRWAALNGVVEFADFVQGHESKRTQSLLFGKAQNIKQQAFDLLREPSLAGVK